MLATNFGEAVKSREERVTMSEYIPSPWRFVAEQVEQYVGSGGTEGFTLMDTGLPVIIVGVLTLAIGAVFFVGGRISARTPVTFNQS